MRCPDSTGREPGPSTAVRVDSLSKEVNWLTSARDDALFCDGAG